MRPIARSMMLGSLLLVLAGCAARAPERVRTPERVATEKVFDTPMAAVDALVAACRGHDDAALAAIFGADAMPLLSSGNSVADADRCRRFVAAAGQMTRLDPYGPDALELVVGTDDWPFPIPLEKAERGWRFDTVRGAREIASRRIGANEREAIAFCRAYVGAQEEYARVPREGRERQYAQKLVSTPGRRDGLYWPATAGAGESPLGPEVTAAGDHSNGGRPARSWWGYHFRVLTAQGNGAPGGPQSYVVGGAMVGGFALIAYPAQYGSTGIMTFLVDRDGHIYERDLGEKTDTIAAAIREYDPRASWKSVTD